MTSLSVSTKGHSPKKVSGWMWFLVVTLVLFVVGNAIYMASDIGAAEEETAEGSDSSGDATTADLALARAKEKVQAVLDKQRELHEAPDDETKARLHAELSQLIQDALSEDMKEAIREDPDAITLAIAEMLRDAIIAEEIAVDVAQQAGNVEGLTDHALAAQELKILLDALRGSLNSASYPRAAAEIDSIIAEAQASAARSASWLMPFYK